MSQWVDQSGIKKAIKHKVPSIRLSIVWGVFPSDSRLCLLALLSLIPSGAAAPIPVAVETDTAVAHARREEHTRNRTHTQRATQCTGRTAARTRAWGAPEPSVSIRACLKRSLHSHTH